LNFEFWMYFSSESHGVSGPVPQHSSEHEKIQANLQTFTYYLFERKKMTEIILWLWLWFSWWLRVKGKSQWTTCSTSSPSFQISWQPTRSAALLLTQANFLANNKSLHQTVPKWKKKVRLCCLVESQITSWGHTSRQVYLFWEVWMNEWMKMWVQNRSKTQRKNDGMRAFQSWSPTPKQEVGFILATKMKTREPGKPPRKGGNTKPTRADQDLARWLGNVAANCQGKIDSLPSLFPTTSFVHSCFWRTHSQSILLHCDLFLWTSSFTLFFLLSSLAHSHSLISSLFLTCLHFPSCLVAFFPRKQTKSSTSPVPSPFSSLH